MAITAVTAIGTMVLLAFADTREVLNKKADKTELLSLQDRVKSMDDKLDFIIYMHIDENGDIQRHRTK